ncbi:MAG: helix-turn-helix domain-containing protein [Pseudonocardia sp.]
MTEKRTAQTTFAMLFKHLREESGLSYRELERPTLATRGWISNVASGARWPERDWVDRADKVLKAGDLLLRAWDAGQAERDEQKRTRSILLASVKDSEEILLATAPDAVDVDALNESAASLGVAYLSSPAAPMLEHGVKLRREIVRRIREGAARPHEMDDLYLAAGRASGVLSYAALDLGNPEAAAIHARAAWQLADIARDDELRAWVRGTESLVARFQKNYRQAGQFIVDGLKYAGPGTSTVRLLCGAAQCAANSGDSSAAQHILDMALNAREQTTPDTINGLFAFSYAKQLYYAGSSLMWLDDEPALRRAARDAQEAIVLWEHEGEQFRSLDDEALAHVYTATALLKLGEIEGAMAAVRPILALPPERQISWIHRRVAELAVLLDDDRFKNSRAAAAARDELRAAA